MTNEFYKQLISQSPIGYAYHRIICDQKGLPIDYEFIEVNDMFERLTGLKKKEIQLWVSGYESEEIQFRDSKPS